MSKNIAPIVGTVTAGQIGRLMDRLSERCRVNAHLLLKDSVQVVLEGESDWLTHQMFEILRTRVEQHSIVRRVSVDRNRTPVEMLMAAVGCISSGINGLDSIPRGEGDKVEVLFFKLDVVCLNHEDLEKEFESRRIKPVDPYSLAAVNEADCHFLTKHPHITHWKDKDNEWCYMGFQHPTGRCVVRVGRGNDYDLRSYNWIAGLRK